MTTRLKLALAQLNLLVGDVPGNVAQITAAIAQARTLGTDLVVFPELALCGYPPEDLLFHAGLHRQVGAALEQVKLATTGIAALVGYPNTPAGSFTTRGPVRRRQSASELPQAGAAQLQRVRRAALFPARCRRGGGRRARAYGSASASARMSGRPAPARRRVTPARSSWSCPTVRRSRSASSAARAGAGRARPRHRPAHRLRQPGGRSGRTGLRRRLLPGRCQRRRQHARTGLRRRIVCLRGHACRRPGARRAR